MYKNREIWEKNEETTRTSAGIEIEFMTQIKIRKTAEHNSMREFELGIESEFLFL
jgi:hypothetical protein